jgi:hypothetical protein
VVGVLTAVTFALLVWIEIRSRRHRAAAKVADAVSTADGPSGKRKS